MVLSTGKQCWTLNIERELEMMIEDGDAQMWCDRCGAEIPIGCDILTYKEVRVGLGCWDVSEGWQSAGSKLYHFFTTQHMSLDMKRDNTTTGRLMTALEEAICHQFDIVISEHNDWFNELLDRRIDDRLRVWSEVSKYIGEQNNEMS